MTAHAGKPIPLSREPTGVITDGQMTVGYLFDTAAGIVATLADRVPLGTFAKAAEARTVIYEVRLAREREVSL